MIRLTLKVTLWSAVFAVLAGISVVFWLVTTEPGARFVGRTVSEMLSAIEIEVRNGTIAKGVGLDYFRYSSDSVDVEIENAQVAWQTSCLFKAAICADSLSLDLLQIVIKPTTENATSPDESNGLPVVPAPFPINIQAGKIGTLRLVTESAIEEITNIQLQADWQHTLIAIANLDAGYRGLRLNAAGSFDMAKPWLTDLSGGLRLPDEILALTGADQLPVDGRVPFRFWGTNLDYNFDFSETDWLPVSLLGAINFDSTEMPFKATLKTPAKLIVGGEPLIVFPKSAETVVNTNSKAKAGGDPQAKPEPEVQGLPLEYLDIEIAGTLIDLSAQTTIKFSSPQIPFNTVQSDIALRNDTLALDHFTLFAVQGQASGKAEIQFDEVISLNIDIEAQQLNLLDAMPDLPLYLDGRILVRGQTATEFTDIRLDLKNLDLIYAHYPVRISGGINGRLDNQAWSLSGNPRVQTNLWSEFNTEFRLSGTSQVIHAEKIRLNSQQGGLDVFGRYNLDSQKWHGELALNKIAIRLQQLQDWLGVEKVADLSGEDLIAFDAGLKFAGKGESTGEVSITKLTGTAGKHQISGTGKLAFNQGSTPGLADLSLDKVKLNLGPSRIALNGTLASASDLRLQLENFDLNLTGLETTGTVSTDLNITGNIATPNIAGTVVAQNLAWQTLRAENLALDLDIEALGNGPSRITASIADAHVDHMPVSQFESTIEGSLGETRSDIAIKFGRDSRAKLVCDTSLITKAGNLRVPDFALKNIAVICDQIDVGIAQDFWQLTDSLSLHYDLAGSALSIEPVCFERRGNGPLSMASDLCLTKVAAVSPQEKRANLMFTDFPVDWFRHYWPQVSNLNGYFSGKLSFFDRVDAPLNARIDLNSDALKAVLSVSEGTDYRPVLLNDIAASLVVDGDQAESQLKFGLGQGGDVTMDLGVNDLSGAKRLVGTVEVNAVDVSVLKPFSTEIQELSGFLNAGLNIDGDIADPALSGWWKLEQGRLSTVSVPETLEQITLEGLLDKRRMTYDGRFTNQQGVAFIDGSMDWQEELLMLGRLRSDGITVVPQHGMSILLQPDVTVEIKGDVIKARGQVNVPRARLELQRLPANAKSTSADARIINRQRASTTSLYYDAQLELLLGDDVRFTGLGLNAYLTGYLDLYYRDKGELTAQGEIESREGVFTYLGQRLEVQNGILYFHGPIEDPDVFIEAVRNAQSGTVKAGLRVTGPVSQPELEVFSDPPMNDASALHYLLTGNAPDSESQAGGGLVGNLLLSRAGLGADWLNDNVMSRFGVSDFQVSTQAEDGGTSVQLSGYLSPDLYLRYGVNLFDQVNTLAMRYRLRSNLFIEAMTGLDSSLDVIYSFEVH
ncbi:hypothetical protein OLMES_3251 [Oleiphilus messinensis]|uniref:Translocation and assembly module TamB C-terminal domain-containing protein n=1 Tax=Oleiphilus messinensis TaxID=141451 RepID=A0A1Y0I9T9_9GAMM|nr:translocation/assembly module TamB domain-containing protein [Oleiphilus messinensis]ARU57292.1 hypothetical protein OLMES_3251 [Oleiphilus messinensis]